MSVEAIALVLHHSGASGTPKVVLLGIANHDGDGGAWPSIETLMKYANVEESSVHRAVTKLVGLGEIRVHRNAGGTRETRGDRRPNRYEILVRCPAGCDGTTAHRVASVGPREGDGVPLVLVRGTAGASDGVPLVAPEPSFQPSLEPSVSDEHPLVVLSERVAKKAKEVGATEPFGGDPFKIDAQRVAGEFWESRTPKPTVPFLAVRKIVETALRAGWSAEQVAWALPRTHLSGAALGTTLERRYPPTVTGSPPMPTVGADPNFVRPGE